MLVLLIKKQSTQLFCDIDVWCTECAQVDFKMSDVISEDFAVSFKYSVANKGSIAVDTIEMVDRDRRTTGESKVV